MISIFCPVLLFYFCIFYIKMLFHYLSLITCWIFCSIFYFYLVNSLIFSFKWFNTPVWMNQCWTAIQCSHNNIMQHPKFPVISHYLWQYRKWSYHVETELPLLNTAWGGPSPLPSYALWCHCGTWVHSTQKGQLSCVFVIVFTYTCWLFEWLTNFWTSCTMLCVFMKKTSLSDFLFSVAAWLSSILAIWHGKFDHI